VITSDILVLHYLVVRVVELLAQISDMLKKRNRILKTQMKMGVLRMSL
jgi:hypothetical protein